MILRMRSKRFTNREPLPKHSNPAQDHNLSLSEAKAPLFNVVWAPLSGSPHNSFQLSFLAHLDCAVTLISFLAFLRPQKSPQGTDP